MPDRHTLGVRQAAVVRQLACESDSQLAGPEERTRRGEKKYRKSCRLIQLLLLLCSLSLYLCLSLSLTQTSWATVVMCMSDHRAKNATVKYNFLKLHGVLVGGQKFATEAIRKVTSSCRGGGCCRGIGHRLWWWRRLWRRGSGLEASKAAAS